MAVHGTVAVSDAQRAEGLGLVRSARTSFDRDPALALRRLGELEALLEDLMACCRANHRHSAAGQAETR